MILYLIYDHCLVIEGFRYHQANGRLKPDAIPTVLFPINVTYLDLSTKSTCYTPLMASRSLSISTSYCKPIRLAQHQYNHNWWHGLDWSRFSFEFSLLLLAVIKTHHAHSLASLTMSTDLLSRILQYTGICLPAGFEFTRGPWCGGILLEYSCTWTSYL